MVIRATVWLFPDVNPDVILLGTHKNLLQKKLTQLCLSLSFFLCYLKRIHRAVRRVIILHLHTRGMLASESVIPTDF